MPPNSHLSGQFLVLVTEPQRHRFFRVRSCSLLGAATNGFLSGSISPGNVSAVSCPAYLNRSPLHKNSRAEATYCPRFACVAARIALMNTDTKKFRHCSSSLDLDTLTDYIDTLFARIKKGGNYVPA